MNAIVRRLFLLVFSIASAAALVGQPVLTSRQFAVDDGLPSNVITSMCQTPDHLMWFSSWNGLTNYDGYQFNTYNEQTSTSHVLSSNYIYNLEADSRGNVWCVTYDLRVYVFDRTLSDFVSVSDIIRSNYEPNYQCTRTKALPNGHVWLYNNDRTSVWYRIDINQYTSPQHIQGYGVGYGNVDGDIFNVDYDDDGREWLLTSSGAHLVDGELHTSLPYRHLCQIDTTVFLCTSDGQMGQYCDGMQQEQSVSLPVPVSNVQTMGRTTSQQLLLGTDAGLLSYDVNSNQWQQYVMPQVQQLYVDHRGYVWTYSSDGQFRMTDLKTHQVHSFAGQPMSAPRLYCKTIFLEDLNGTLWLMSDRGGSYCYDELNQSLVECHFDYNLGYIDKNYFIDDQKHLWMGASQELVQISFGYRHFRNIATPGISYVRGLGYDSHGDLWTGDGQGNLHVISPDGSHRLIDLRPYGHQPGVMVYSVTEDSRGRMWIGFKGEGLYCIDGSQVRHFQHSDTDPYSLSSDQVYSVFEDRQHHLWVGTFQRGICLIDERPSGQVLFLHPGNEMQGYPSEICNKVRRITQTRDGVILVSCSNGFLLFSDRFDTARDIQFYVHTSVEGDDSSLLTSDVMHTQVGSDGRVYVATRGGGLQRIVNDTLLQEHLNFESVLPMHDRMGVILSMVNDDEGNLWIGRENSISRYSPQTGTVLQFGYSYIGQKAELTEALATRSKTSGDICFATQQGCLSFNPHAINIESSQPPLLFKTFQFHGLHQAPLLINDDYIRVPSAQRNLSISFAAIDYSDNSMVRYAYRLEGVDQDWIDLGNNRTITFNDIPSGRQRLQIRSSNTFGSFDDSPLSVKTLELDVEPYFSETIWAYFLWMFIALGIIFLGVFIYVLHTRAVMERRLSQMKTDFFSNISHKLRTPLTLIGGPVHEVLQNQTLTTHNRQMLEMVERNSQNMLSLVNNLLSYNDSEDLYISDDNALTATVQSSQPIDDEEPEPVTYGRLRLLVVEDNSDLRQYLRSILSSEYEVMLAENGRIGLEMTRQQLPDFIITDVMMPEMDGLQMIQAIKADTDVSHIPIIVLSAKASLSDRLEGLRQGINDYITKPFSATYLKQRMENIILNQKILQQRSVAQLSVPQSSPEQAIKLKDLNITDTDQIIIDKVIAYIDEHMDDSKLKISDIASHVSLGRTVFYNKVRTIMGMSPVELLIHLRISRAEQLIAQTKEPISQIAYRVGFSDARYFGKIFKQQTGMTPTEYRERS